MNIKATVISSFARFVLGSGTFEKVKDIVIKQEGSGLKGDEKRKAAIEELKLLGINVMSWALGLAIELSVTYLRTLAGENINGK